MCNTPLKNREENWTQLTIAKTSGTVSLDRGKNWPTADPRVPVTSQKSLRKLTRSSFFLVSINKAANNDHIPDVER